ncbi:dihydroorotase [Lactobacillus selangorensis]|uniref:Dihydroorotase n=1 Tax=Lactobacillus selangorensis TaxID=81857 RepID=A0A0R2FXA1_9LACO|nr:dihydroorotase [Lactobacillus selangorensis]KRN28774.1 dihydroorotase [Lactobacillus selangorensis]KRN32816.1 dihydroorotase [Lactobacillus selangorensis]
MTYLLKNGHILGQHGLQPQDILIDGQTITAMAAHLDTPADATVLDLEGGFISPGLVDVHVHFRDPGQTDKETIRTGSAAAAHGGFTFVGAMPNITPTTDTPAAMTAQIKRNQTAGKVRIGQYAPITMGRTGDKLVDFAALQKAGAFAFSNDGSGIQSAETMYLAMQGIEKTGLPLAAHVEDVSLFNHGVINAGPRAQELNLPGIDKTAETAQLARDLVLAQATGVHYHVCHVSTAESLQMIRMAKMAGVNVTCEAAPHHLLLSDQDIPDTDNSNFKMNPPLRSESDRQALVVGLLDGTVDCIATDHAPHTQAEKDQGILKAPFGIVGSENAFSLLYTRFVRTKLFTLGQLIAWMSARPAKLFNVPAPQLKVGHTADLAVFDLAHQQTITAEQLVSKGKNTPFLGTKVYGGTLATFVGGQPVYQRGELQ